MIPWGTNEATSASTKVLCWDTSWRSTLVVNGGLSMLTMVIILVRVLVTVLGSFQRSEVLI